MMKPVSRDQFEELYFRLGGGARTGWSADYWNQFFSDEKPGMKYLVEEPETPEHTRMMIVSDSGAQEHRMCFMTEAAEERLFDRG